MLENCDGMVEKTKAYEDILKGTEENFQNLLDSFPLSIFLLEKGGDIYYCNRVAELYFNKVLEELSNHNFFELFHLPKKKLSSLNEIISNVYNFDLSEIVELEFVNHKNSKTWVEVFFSSVKISRKKFIQIILQDITERKLVDEIIKEENKKLKELDQMKKQLTARTSEELTSPLNVVSNASEFLLNSYKDKLDPDAIQLLELIKNVGEKSKGLVERILDISRIESDKFNLRKQTASLVEIITESVDDVMGNVKKHDYALSFDLTKDLYSEVDILRFGQLIKDLMLKAIKNTPKRGKISIGLRESGDQAEISIKTNGLISKGHESDLELHFSKEIVELHGGKIEIKTEENNGTNFIIHMPIKNWSDTLIQMYIIYKGGIPLYDHAFVKNNTIHSSSLISGGIIGMMTILKEIFRGENQIKTIDHGDRKIMFEYNRTKDVIFVLIVKENLVVFERKLDDIIEEFDIKFEDLIKNIEKTSVEVNNWEDLGVLIEKHFGKCK